MSSHLLFTCITLLHFLLYSFFVLVSTVTDLHTATAIHLTCIALSLYNIYIVLTYSLSALCIVPKNSNNFSHIFISLTHILTHMLLHYSLTFAHSFSHPFILSHLSLSLGFFFICHSAIHIHILHSILPTLLLLLHILIHTHSSFSSHTHTHMAAVFSLH